MFNQSNLTSVPGNYDGMVCQLKNFDPSLEFFFNIARSRYELYHVDNQGQKYLLKSFELKDVADISASNIINSLYWFDNSGEVDRFCNERDAKDNAAEHDHGDLDAVNSSGYFHFKMREGSTVFLNNNPVSRKV